MVRAGGDGPWQGLSCWHGSRSCLAARRRRRPQASDRRPGARGGPRQHPDREAARRARPDEAGAVRHLVREARHAPRATRTGHRGAGGRRGRAPGRHAGRRRGEGGRSAQARPAGPAGAPAARERGPRRSLRLPGLRRELAPDRRGRDREPRLRPGPVQGRAPRARGVRLPRLRAGGPGAGPPTMRFPAGGPVPGSWPTSRWRSSTTIFRCIARPRSTRATASIWRPRRSRAGSARLRPRCSR